MSETKREYWSKLIAEQEASGRRRGLSVVSVESESIRQRRRRLRQGETVQFALLETAAAATVSQDSTLELVLRNGKRLRIGNQVGAATLRMVLEAVRG